MTFPPFGLKIFEKALTLIILPRGAFVKRNRGKIPFVFCDFMVK